MVNHFGVAAGPIQLTFTLKHEGATISGEVSSPFGTFLLSGSLSGNELSFAFTAKIQDQEVPVTGKGSIDGNSDSRLDERDGT